MLQIDLMLQKHQDTQHTKKKIKPKRNAQRTVERLNERIQADQMCTRIARM